MEFLFQKLRVSLIELLCEKPACINSVLSFLYLSQVTTIFLLHFISTNSLQVLNTSLLRLTFNFLDKELKYLWGYEVIKNPFHSGTS